MSHLHALQDFGGPTQKGTWLWSDYDILDDLIRSIETERGGVADIQLHDEVTFLLQPVGFGQDRAANVVADVHQFEGFLKGWLGHAVFLQ